MLVVLEVVVMGELGLGEVLLRLVVGTLLGAAVGLEREAKGKAAGLRTNALVGAGAALLGVLSVAGFPGESGVDESRVAAAVVSGVGFLGAGVIFALGGRPRNLTTAAALWTAAAVGLAAGLGHAAAATVTAVLVVVLLLVVDAVVHRVAGGARPVVRDAYVVAARAAVIGEVADVLAEHGVTLRHLAVADLGDEVGLDLVIEGTEAAVEAALAATSRVDDVVWAGSEQGLGP